MATLGEVLVRFGADTRQLDRSLNGIRGQANQTGQTLQRAFSSAIGQATRFGSSARQIGTSLNSVRTQAGRVGDSLRRGFSTAVSQVTRFGTSTRQISTSLNSVTNIAGRIGDSLRRGFTNATSQVTRFVSNARQVSPSLNSVINVAGRMGDTIRRGFQTATSQVTRLGTSARQITSSLSGVGNVAGRVGNLFRRGFQTAGTQATSLVQDIRRIGTSLTSTNSLFGRMGNSIRTAFQSATSSLSRFRTNATQVNSSLSNVSRQAERTGGTLRRIFEFTGGNLLANALSRISSGLVEVGKKAIKLASDLQEVQNVVDTTFKESAEQINKFAKSALKSFGLSELQAKQFAGSMGAMLKSSGIATDKLVEMSTGLVGLAGDFASFYNLEHEDAWEKIRSGISGETEPLKILGINMSVANLEAYALSKGISKAWKEMSQAEQVTLRYNYLLEQSKDAQGDFAKTQGAYANQMRLLKTTFEEITAKMASAFLPMLTKVASKLNTFLSNIDLEALQQKFESFAKGVETVITAMVRAIQGDFGAFYEILGSTSMVSLQTLDIITPIFETLRTVIVGAINIIRNNISLLITSLISLGVTIVSFQFMTFINGLGGMSFAIRLLKDNIIALRTTFMTLAMNPFLWWAIGIGAVIGGVILLIKHWNELPAIFERVKATVTTFFANFSAGFTALVTKFREILPQIITAIDTNLPILLSTGQKIITTMLTSISQNLPLILQKGGEILNNLLNGLQNNLPMVTQTVLSIIMTLFNNFINNLPLILNIGLTILTNLINGIMQNLPQIISVVTNIIITLMNALITMIPTLISAGLVILTALINGITESLPKIIEAGVQIITKLVDALIQNLPALIDGAIKIIVALVDGLIQNLPKLITAAIQIITALINGLIENLPTLIGATIYLMYAIVNGLIENLPLILAGALRIIGALVMGLLKGIPQLIAGAFKLVKALDDTIKNTNWLKLGADIIRGLINGIGSMLGTLYNKARDIANSVKNALSNALKIKSPSRVMFEIGGNIGQGIANGITKAEKLVDKAMFRTAGTISVGLNTVDSKQLTTGFTSKLSPSTKKTSATGLVINVTGNSINSEIDVNTIANRITQRLRGAGVY